MRKFIIAAAVLVPAALACLPAQARPIMPWCAVINQGFGSVYWDCSYPTVKSCVPAILAGSRGFCAQNPAFGDDQAIEHKARKKARNS